LPQVLRISLLLPLLTFCRLADAAPSFLEFWQAVQSRNLELKALDADHLASDSWRRSSTSFSVPRIPREACCFQSSKDYPSSVQQDGGWRLTLSAQQTILDLKAWSESRQLETESALALLHMDNAKNNLRFSVLQQYWQAVLLNEKIHSYQTHYAPLIQQIESHGEDATLEALRSRPDRMQWILSIRQMQLQMLQNEDDLVTQLENLKSMAGWESLQLPRRKLTFVPEEKWLSTLPKDISKSPNLRVAEINVQKAANVVNDKGAEFFPRFFLFADWQKFQGSTSFSMKERTQEAGASAPEATLYSSYGVAMQWTLFDGLRTYQSGQGAKHTRDAAAWRLADTQSSLLRSSKELQSRLESTLHRFKLLAQLRSETRAALDDVQSQQKAGLRSFDAIIVPLAQAYDAENLYFQSLQTFFGLYWKLLNDLGHLDDLSIEHFANHGLDEGG